MTIIKHSNQRVGVLIDAQNLYHSAQNLYGSRVNFTKVLEEAVAGRVLVRAIAYVITSESGEESTFFEALEQAGIETKAKDLQVFSGGAKKADWDVGIAVDAIKLGHSLDALVIASGDGDFIPAVKYVQHATGCQVEVISFGRSTSSALIEVADDFIDMCDEKEEYLMNSRTARRHNKRKFGSRSRTYNNRSSQNTSQETQANASSNSPTKSENVKNIDRGQATQKSQEKKELLETEPKKQDTSKPRVTLSKNSKEATKSSTKKDEQKSKKAAPKKPVEKKPQVKKSTKDTQEKKSETKTEKKTTQIKRVIRTDGKKTPAQNRSTTSKKPAKKAPAKKTTRKAPVKKSTKKES